MIDPYPFALDASIGGIGALHEVRARCAASASADAREPARALLKSFAALVQAGAFAGADRRPYGETLRASELVDHGAEIMLRLDVGSMQRSAFAVLVNALAVESYTGGGIEHVSIRCLDSPREDDLLGPPWLLNVLQRAEYPGPTERRTFVLDRRIPGSYRSERRAVVAFDQALTEATQTACIEALQDWCRIAFGGYPGDASALMDGEGLVLDADAMPFEDASIEITTDRFDADEAAWNSLIGVVQHLHDTLTPVGSLTIW